MASVLSTYVQVILPLPLATTFTYSVPDAMRDQVTVGSRVIVPFGKRKFYTAIVEQITPIADTPYQVKEIISVLDRFPILRHPQLKFWEWLAEYYLCAVGDVFKAAVPTGLKIESETNFEANPDFEADDISLLSEREAIVWQIIQTRGKLSTKDLEKETGFKNMAALMQRMVEKGAAIVSETLVEKFRPKKEKCVRLTIDRGDQLALKQAFDDVKNAKKQETLLMTLIHLSRFMDLTKSVAEVLQDDLLEKAGVTTNILKALVDKGIVERYTRETSRFGCESHEVRALPQLTDHQNEALQQIHSSFKDKNVTLLHGVTSSGKTEIYMHLMQYALEQGLQCLYLVPEIALTTQLTRRLQGVFGSKVVIYHSKFSDNERVEIWNRLLHSNEPCIVIGARSSLFLPFAKLGLVIVDEEHDPSYKQYEPAPRYNARDAAIMLAHMHGAKTLLGSATPAVETYYKALNGKYGLISLSQRFSEGKLPDIQVVDMAREEKKKDTNGSFAKSTIRDIRTAIANGKQAIIFHNRRGYAPLARCKKCQYIPKCHFCDVSLTYHKRINMLVCHYCGAQYPLMDTCPVCQEPAIEVVGYGTERIEDEVENIFSEANILRMDLDTTRNKNSYSNIIDTFSTGKADILIGTQMVTKGLDFANVDIVAVVNADALINYPDFRSAERAFNMLEQVSGRAGRRNENGKVLIQTRSPEHPVVKFAAAHDYLGFYEKETEERRMYAYPPFVRVINIYLKHRDERELDSLAVLYSAELRKKFGTRVNGPTKPMVARIQSLYIRQIMLKVELNASMQRVKEILRQLYIDLCSAQSQMKSAVLYYDVDPY